MIGFQKCCDCFESHLLCDLSKALTDKTVGEGKRRNEFAWLAE